MVWKVTPSASQMLVNLDWLDGFTTTSRCVETLFCYENQTCLAKCKEYNWGIFESIASLLMNMGVSFLVFFHNKWNLLFHHFQLLELDSQTCLFLFSFSLKHPVWLLLAHVGHWSGSVSIKPQPSQVVCFEFCKQSVFPVKPVFLFTPTLLLWCGLSVASVVVFEGRQLPQSAENVSAAGSDRGSKREHGSDCHLHVRHLADAVLWSKLQEGNYRISLNLKFASISRKIYKSISFKTTAPRPLMW